MIVCDVSKWIISISQAQYGFSSQRIIADVVVDQAGTWFDGC